jgi:alkanesulfonate monooxygenase SsuD/methylene tetrahydromethanopterin reductase-like flavin-dependent oxidoreductase (luciferase family)
MRVGIFIPSGIVGEYEGWDIQRAWQRSLEIARLAEELGFDSVWVPDHLQNIRQNDDAPTFEMFVLLSAIAGVTSRVTLAPGVACAGFRSPGLLLKMMATLDVASGGRAEIAIGAGWNRWEWESHGYGFPPARERLALLREHLEIITRMLEPGRTTWQGERVHVENAALEPKGVQQPRMPIIVGGNGPNVTWRLAARYADEINFDQPAPHLFAEWVPIVHQRCEEIGRDPASLKISSLTAWDGFTRQERVEWFQRLDELGMTRIQVVNDANVDSDEHLHALAEDCRAAGVEMLA